MALRWAPGHPAHHIWSITKGEELNSQAPGGAALEKPMIIFGGLFTRGQHCLRKGKSPQQRQH